MAGTTTTTIGRVVIHGTFTPASGPSLRIKVPVTVPTTAARTTTTHALPPVTHRTVLGTSSSGSWNPAFLVGGLSVLIIAAIVVAVRSRTRRQPRTAAAYRNAGTQLAVVSVAFLVGLVAVPEHLSSGRKIFVVLLCIAFAAAIVAVWASLRSELQGSREPRLDYTMANDRDPRIYITNEGAADTFQFTMQPRHGGQIQRAAWESNNLYAVELPQKGQDSVKLSIWGSVYKELEPTVDLTILTHKHLPYTKGLVLRRVLGIAECRWEDELWPQRSDDWISRVRHTRVSCVICLHDLRRLDEARPINLEAIRNPVKALRDEIQQSGLLLGDQVIVDDRPVTVPVMWGQHFSDGGLLQAAIAIVENWNQVFTDALNRAAPEQRDPAVTQSAPCTSGARRR